MDNPSPSRFVLIHGIPSPYRLHLFTVLDMELRKRGWSFEVHFMKECDGDRAHWNTELNVSFEYRFWKNWKLPTKKGNFNPGLLKYLKRENPEVVMFGGVWSSLTCMAGIAWLRGPLKIGWYEANSLIPGKTDCVSKALKCYLLSRLDWHALPGRYARDFLQNLMPKRFDTLSISELPNLVDETRFGGVHSTQADKVRIRERLGVPIDKLLVLTIARMIPEKNLISYLREIAPCCKGNVHYLIVGDGPQKEAVLSEIQTLRIGNWVTLHGSVSYEQMPQIYSAADVFCLPSVEDSNPLSVIEAMYSRLPLMLSNQVGNYPEALVEGVNGYAFDPRIPGEITATLQKMLTLDGEEIARMGGESQIRAAEKWTSDASIIRFLDPILSLPSSESTIG